MLREGEKHDYVSTACQHGIHEQCRKSCKFCEALCKCGCHDLHGNPNLWHSKENPQSVIGSLRIENERLRAAIRNQAGDDLCWFDASQLYQLNTPVKIPPWAEFQESCRRFHAQMTEERGVLEGSMTIAQLESEVERLRAVIAEKAS